MYLAIANGHNLSYLLNGWCAKACIAARSLMTVLRVCQSTFCCMAIRQIDIAVCTYRLLAHEVAPVRKRTCLLPFKSAGAIMPAGGKFEADFR